jgi:hypothetical protein
VCWNGKAAVGSLFGQRACVLLRVPGAAAGDGVVLFSLFSLPFSLFFVRGDAARLLERIAKDEVCAHATNEKEGRGGSACARAANRGGGLVGGGGGKRGRARERERAANAKKGVGGAPT